MSYVHAEVGKLILIKALSTYSLHFPLAYMARNHPINDSCKQQALVYYLYNTVQKGTGIWMFSLVYSSRAFRTLNHDDLFLLLTQSRKNNQLHNITGVLLYSDNKFIQIIEGEKNNVLALYAKIRNDIRHKEIKLIMSKDIEERKFPDWSMGFSDADETEKHNIPGYSRFLETDFEKNPLAMENCNTLDLLHQFKQNVMLTK